MCGFSQRGQMEEVMEPLDRKCHCSGWIAFGYPSFGMGFPFKLSLGWNSMTMLSGCLVPSGLNPSKLVLLPDKKYLVRLLKIGILMQALVFKGPVGRVPSN